jgi:hypothetical protein
MVTSSATDPMTFARHVEEPSTASEADLELRTFRWKEQALYLFVLRIGLSENRSALFCPML